MKLKDIALNGLKGRRKDTLLLKLVITLSFTFIISAVLFQSSLERTKLEQRLDLYGEWQGAYLAGDEETLEKLKSEEDIDRIGISLIIGKTEKSGVLGTFNDELVDLGRFTLYKGEYPRKPNEIMLELNEMSKMGLDLEVGQKVQIAVNMTTVDESEGPYIMELNKRFYEEQTAPLVPYYEELDRLYEELEELESKEAEDDEDALKRRIRIGDINAKIQEIYDKRGTNRYPTYYLHHETPFEQIGDVAVVASNDYFFYYLQGDEVNPEIIREKGFLRNQKIILKKEFTITGILDTYSDKWDLGDYMAPNAFITEEGGESFTNALYNNSIADLKDYKFYYHLFLGSSILKEKLYENLYIYYPNREVEINDKEYHLDPGFRFWMDMYGASDEQVEDALKEINKWNVPRLEEDWRDEYLEGSADTGSKVEINRDNFRRNTFSYPKDSTSTEHILTLTIIAIIFVATALAILQIFLTQMKRRSRKIVLLKSIGATNLQIVKILFYEGIFLLKTGLLVGVPSGFGLAYLLVFFMNNANGRKLEFHVLPSLLFWGVLAGILALFLGMSVPMAFAVKIPMVGTMSKPPKHRKKKRKGEDELKSRGFNSINWQYIKQNKGKSLVSLGISLITVTVLLSSLLLTYLSFDNYRHQVLRDNRPDYSMETYFGESTRALGAFKDEIMGIKGVKSAEAYKVGKQTFLWFENIDDSVLLRTLEKTLPSQFKSSYFSKYNNSLVWEPLWIKNAFFTRTYGLDVDGNLFRDFERNLTIGNINKEEFEKGEEVILLIPLQYSGNKGKILHSKETILSSTSEGDRIHWLLKNSADFHTSYEGRFKDYYTIPGNLKPGDKIFLSADEEKISGMDYVNSFVSREKTVGGIVYYFIDIGIWPFSKDVTPFIVVTSYNGMESLYPKSRIRSPGITLDYMKSMVSTIYPTSYGRTLWYINTDFMTRDAVMDSELLAIANNNGYTLFNYKDSNSKLYYEGLNNGIIISLLGLTAAAIAFIILYNITVSKLEQDRNRIGILQSMGVTKKEFSRLYIGTGAINGLISLVISHLMLLIVMFLSSIGMGKGLTMEFSGYMKDIFAYRLWGYPWKIHILLSVLFFIVTVLIYYIPSRYITEKYPVENIRSLSR